MVLDKDDVQSSQEQSEQDNSDDCNEAPYRDDSLMREML